MNKSKFIINCLVSLVFFGGVSSLATAQNKKLVVAGIVFQTDTYMRTCMAGLRAAAKEQGFQLLEGMSDNKIEKEASLIDTYITRGVDAIALTPISKTNSKAALKRARDKGIKIISFGTTTDDSVDQAQVASSDAEMGRLAGEYAKSIIDKMPGKVKVATVAFKSQVPQQSDDRTNGFLDVVKDKIDLVSQQDAWLPEQAVKVVGDILTANPDLQVIYAANEGGTVGAVQAVKNAGKAGKVMVFDSDSSEQIIQMLKSKDNILQSSSAQQPFLVGKLAGDAAIKLIKGEAVTFAQNADIKLLPRNDIKVVDEELKFLKSLK